MEMPNASLLMEAVTLVAVSLQADMAILFQKNPSDEELRAARDANEAWDKFCSEHPEVLAYLEEQKVLREE